MSGGLFALLDDIATLARMAAASTDDIAAAAGRASAKAAGVVVDDTAVTPRYVAGVGPERELPIIKQIAAGSLRNKLVFILPAALVLSQFAPRLLTPILMLGGAYLCFEAMEKIWERLFVHDVEHAKSEVTGGTVSTEKTMVAGAIRTDLILSAEIMVIALNEVADEPLLSRALILAIVAVGITLLVYGVVAVIVKMDDIGLSLVARGRGLRARFGAGLVKAMPGLLAAISVIGIAAMLWVGGHLIFVGIDELGWHWLYDVVHHRVESAQHAAGAAAGWLITTVASALVGLVVGTVAVLVGHLVEKARGRRLMK